MAEPPYTDRTERCACGGTIRVQQPADIGAIGSAIREHQSTRWHRDYSESTACDPSPKVR